MTQERGDDTHRRLLEAAAALFGERGYEGTGVAEICERAGLSKGAFYHHFSTKQAIFLELLDAWTQGLSDQLAAMGAEAHSVPESLTAMMGGLDLVLASARGRLPIFFEFLIQAQRDPAVWATTIQPYRRYRAFFAEMVRLGVAEGSFAPVDADAAAYAIVSLGLGLLLQSLVDPQGADWPRVAGESVRLMLKGLGYNGRPIAPHPAV